MNSKLLEVLSERELEKKNCSDVPSTATVQHQFTTTKGSLHYARHSEVLENLEADGH